MAEMVCMDCGRTFSGEDTPGPFKRCPKCQVAFMAYYRALSAEERDRGIAEGLERYAKHKAGK